MILDDLKVIELIKKPVNSKKIECARKLNKSSQVHFTGENYLSLITQLVGRETAKEYNEKRGLAEPVTMKQTKFIFKELTRFKNNPEIKRTYDFGNANADKVKFENTLKRIYNGESIESFSYDTLTKAIFENFNDFILIEKPALIDGDNENVIVNGIVTSKNTAPTHYIVVIEIDDVKDVKKNGQKVEYIIYEYDKKKVNNVEYQRYRVIDERTDRIYIQMGNEVRLDLSEKIIILKSGIPVIQIGDEFKEIDDYEVTISPINHVIPLMDRYVKFDAMNLVSETKSAYPKEWMYGMKCERCEGTGKIDNPIQGEPELECPVCHGTKLIPPVGNGEPLLLPPTYAEGQTAFSGGTPAGIINTDVAILSYQKERLKERDEEIIKSALGSYMNIEQSASTATEAVINIKPLEDRNSEIAKKVERVENFVCNYIGKDLSINFKSYSVSIPKKLNILDENSLIKQINDAKSNGLSSSYIKELQKELIYSVYRNDSNMLERQLALIELEPFSGYSIMEIKDMTFVKENDKILKMYFTDIIDSFEEEKGDIILTYKKQNGINEIKKYFTDQVLTYKQELSN